MPSDEDKGGLEPSGDETPSGRPAAPRTRSVEELADEGFAGTGSGTGYNDRAAGAGSRREDSKNDALAMQLLRMLAHDNTVMECNLREYDEALGCTLREVVRLKAEVHQMEHVCGQVGQLQALLHREMHVHAQLKQENLELQDKNHELCSVIQEAAEVADPEGAAIIDGLIYENTALRRLLFRTDALEQPGMLSRPAPPFAQGVQPAGAAAFYGSDQVADRAGSGAGSGGESPENVDKSIYVGTKVSSAEEMAECELGGGGILAMNDTADLTDVITLD